MRQCFRTHFFFRIVCRMLLALTIAYYTSFMTVQFFSCPLKMSNVFAMAQKCAEISRAIWVGAGAGTMCVDFANVVLPLRLLWRLNVEVEKKGPFDAAVWAGILVSEQS